MAYAAPGPWRVNATPSRVTIEAVDHGTDLRIATATVGRFTPEGTLANARLIAAAPSLLDALERIAAFCREVSPNYDGDSDYDMFLRWSRDAIAAARGQA